MPTKTFLNLSEKKRQKIVDAAIKELSSVPFEKTSINKIIKDAGISRGSFYMYFEDKYDLTLYLFMQTKDFIINQAKAISFSVSGELDEFMIQLHDMLYDYYMQDEYRNFLKNVVTYYQGRPESELKSMKGMFPLEDEAFKLSKILNKEQFTNQDSDFIIKVINLSVMILRNTMFIAFMMNYTKEQSHNLLKQNIDILKNGYRRAKNA
jgi:AcrR family transcriptional regulator